MSKCTPKIYNGIIKTGDKYKHTFHITAGSQEDLGPVDFSWVVPNGLIMCPDTISNPTVGTYTQGGTSWTNVNAVCGQTVSLDVQFEVTDDSKAPFKIDTKLEHLDCASCDQDCYIEFSGITKTDLVDCVIDSLPPDIVTTIEAELEGTDLIITYVNEDASNPVQTIDLSAFLDDTDTDFKCVPRIDNSDLDNPLLCFDLVNNVTGNVVTPDVACAPLGQITPVEGGNNVTVTGTGSQSDPWIINGCCVIINPENPSTLIITDGEGNETTYVPPAESDLVLTTDGDATGVTQSGTADHTVDIIVTSTDPDNIATVGPEGGTLVTCEDILGCVGTDSTTVVNNGNGTKTLIHTAVDGTVTTWCVPTCNTTIASEVGETFAMDSNCGVQTFNINTNGDLPCETRDEDGNLISSGDGIYTLKGIDNPTNLDLVALTTDGKAIVQPIDCNKPIAEGIQTCIVCPDGTVSNIVTDLFTFTPPPIGDIRVDKNNDTSSNTASTGDTYTYTIVVCNDPNATGPITDITVTDNLPTELTYVSDDGGTGSGVTSNAGQIVTWTFPGPLAPGACESLDIAVEVTGAIGFEFIANITTASGDDGINGPDSTTDSDIDVINEYEASVTTNTVTDENYTNGEFTIEETFIKEPSGALAPCGEPYTRTFKKKSDGSIISEVTGTLCNNDDVWTGAGIGDITPFITGGTGNGQPIIIEKMNAAIAFNINGANADDWIVEIQFGGGECPLSNIDTVELCKVFRASFDNEALTPNEISNDGTTTTYTPIGVGGYEWITNENINNLTTCGGTRVQLKPARSAWRIVEYSFCGVVKTANGPYYSSENGGLNLGIQTTWSVMFNEAPELATQNYVSYNGGYLNQVYINCIDRISAFGSWEAPCESCGTDWLILEHEDGGRAKVVTANISY